jgi:hypothetical protein
MMTIIIIVIIIILIFTPDTQFPYEFLYISNPYTGLEKLWGLQDFEASRIPMRGWLEPWATVRPEGCSNGNRTGDLRDCSEVPQPTAPPRARFSFLILRSLSLPHNRHIYLSSFFSFLLVVVGSPTLVDAFPPLGKSKYSYSLSETPYVYGLEKPRTLVSRATFLGDTGTEVSKVIKSELHQENRDE